MSIILKLSNKLSTWIIIALWVSGLTAIILIIASNRKADEAKDYYGMAKFSMLDGDYADAVNFYTKAMEQEPNDPFLFFSRGEAHEKLGHISAAKVDYLDCLALGFQEYYLDKNRNALDSIAVSLIKLGDPELAESVLKMKKNSGNQ